MSGRRCRWNPLGTLGWLSAGAILVWLMSAASAIKAEDLAAGRFLVASRSLLDPNFAETVVLLIDYNSEGAMGVIINRPTSVTIEQMVPDLGEGDQNSSTVWVGGPVAHWQMVLLYRGATELEESQLVFDDVYFSASRDVLDNLLATEGEFRIYAGYAGWTSGQLEFEIDRGSWHVLPGESDTVFDQAPLEIWRELIARGEAQWADRSPGRLAVRLARR